MSSSKHGFSLLEVLFVLAMLSYMGYMLQPDLQTALTKSTLISNQQSLLQALSQARTWALLNDQMTVVCGWGDTCQSDTVNTPRQILAFADENQDNLWQSHELLLSRFTLRASQITYNRGDSVQFSSHGTTGQAGTWRLCHQANTSGYALVLTSSGNLRSDRIICHV